MFFVSPCSIENSIELFDIISSRGPFNEEESAKIIYNILLAIDGLHQLGVVHRDIKVCISVGKRVSVFLAFLCSCCWVRRRRISWPRSTIRASWSWLILDWLTFSLILVFRALLSLFLILTCRWCDAIRAMWFSGFCGAGSLSRTLWQSCWHVGPRYVIIVLSSMKLKSNKWEILIDRSVVWWNCLIPRCHELHYYGGYLSVGTWSNWRSWNWYEFRNYWFFIDLTA
jgi:hypothetical protein